MNVLVSKISPGVNNSFYGTTRQIDEVAEEKNPTRKQIIYTIMANVPPLNKIADNDDRKMYRKQKLD